MKAPTCLCADETCEKVPQTFSMFQKVVIVHQRSPLKFQACTGTVLGVGLVNLYFLARQTPAFFHPSSAFLVMLLTSTSTSSGFPP